MGPRSIDRGIADAATEAVRIAKLQWGRDQLIAEFSSSSRYSVPSTGLQWGRDQLIAEFGS